MESKRNIDYWEKILKNPRESYKELFDKEELFLKKKIKRNSRVLDIGCGDGRIILLLQDMVLKIIGIDYDERVIKDTRTRFSEEKNIDVVKGNAFDIPFKKEVFDYVLLMMTLVNFSENKLKSLLEMKRVLKKNGSVIISVYSDSAFDERRKMYEKIGVPVKKIKGTTFIFDKNVGANKSEQFSIENLKILCKSANLEIVDYAITKIGLICEIKKVGWN